MSHYEITVKRPTSGGDTGSLMYRGGCTINTPCWWNPSVRIPARSYSDCSATTMSTKLNSKGQPREGIYLPSVPGHSGIFVHMGKGPEWSDGCIVIRETEMLRIWEDITPKDARNVTIKVVDDA